MNAPEVRDRLRDVFVTALDDPGFDMMVATRMGEHPAWDSFAHINLMLGIEAEFGVEFDSDEIGTLLTVGQISDAVDLHLGNAK